MVLVFPRILKIPENLAVIGIHTFNGADDAGRGIATESYVRKDTTRKVEGCLPEELI